MRLDGEKSLSILKIHTYDNISPSHIGYQWDNVEHLYYFHHKRKLNRIFSHTTPNHLLLEGYASLGKVLNEIMTVVIAALFATIKSSLALEKFDDDIPPATNNHMVGVKPPSYRVTRSR